MRILMIGAHQDDAEFLCGGLAALYRERGEEVRFLSVCNGCGGHHIMTPEETSKKRAAESKKVGEYLDIEYEVFGDLDDYSITPTLELRRRLIRYIRAYNPDLVITHRTNDYHADHRTVGMLVQDASYMLIVPHECPDTPPMRRMPVIMFMEDSFRQPPFLPAVIVDIDRVIDKKFEITDINDSQTYEWLPYTYGETVPEFGSREERMAWLRGYEITDDTTDADIAALPRGYVKEFGMTAVRYRRELIEKYGEARGSRVRFAEVFALSEYGAPLTEEMKSKLCPFEGLWSLAGKSRLRRLDV